MRISAHREHGMLLHADDDNEARFLGYLVQNVRSHSYWAANLLEGEITSHWPQFERGVLALLEPIEPEVIARIVGFLPAENVPAPLAPDSVWINGVEVAI